MKRECACHEVDNDSGEEVVVSLTAPNEYEYALGKNLNFDVPAQGVLRGDVLFQRGSSGQPYAALPSFKVRVIAKMLLEYKSAEAVEKKLSERNSFAIY